MAYYLRKTIRSRGTYLQICFSYKDPNYPTPRTRCYETYGYEDDMIANGIKEPIPYLNNIVKKLNEEFHSEKAKKKEMRISEFSPERNLGYFPIASVLKKIDIKDKIDLLNISKCQFSVADCLYSLIYSFLLNPHLDDCGKFRISPTLWNTAKYSDEEIVTCIEFLGDYYEDIVHLFSNQTERFYSNRSGQLYSYNFTIPLRQDQNQQQENDSSTQQRIEEAELNIAILIDDSGIPKNISIKPSATSISQLNPSNIENVLSQKDHSEDLIQIMKGPYVTSIENIDCSGRNSHYFVILPLRKLSNECIDIFENTYKTLISNNDSTEKIIISDRYQIVHQNSLNGQKKGHAFKLLEKRIIFFDPNLAKKQNEKIDKTVNLIKNLFHDDMDISSELFEHFLMSFNSLINSKNRVLDSDIPISLLGYEEIRTSETLLPESRIIYIYDQINLIEKTFQDLCSVFYLDNPNHFSESYIKGFVLICYLSILLVKIFEIKILEKQFDYESVLEFIRNYKIVPYSNKEYLNLSLDSELIKFMSIKYKLPLENLYLSIAKIKKILDKEL